MSKTAEHKATQHLTAATYLLCLATVALVVVTGMLVFVSYQEHRAKSTETATEDSAQWDCVSMGNRVCGPGNPQGKPAACYDQGGVIVALWPCHVVTNSDGSSDVYEGQGK